MLLTNKKRQHHLRKSLPEYQYNITHCQTDSAHRTRKPKEEKRKKVCGVCFEPFYRFPEYIFITNEFFGSEALNIFFLSFL